MSYQESVDVSDRQGNRAWRLFVLLLVALACAPAVVVRMRIVEALEDFDAAVMRAAGKPVASAAARPERLAGQDLSIAATPVSDPAHERP